MRRESCRENGRYPRGPPGDRQEKAGFEAAARAPRAALGQWARCFRRGGRARCRGLVLSRRRCRATRPAAVPPRPHFFLETNACGFLTGPSIKTFPCPGLVLGGGMFVKRRAGQNPPRGAGAAAGQAFPTSGQLAVGRGATRHFRCPVDFRRARSVRVNREFPQVRRRPNLDSRARGAPPSPVASAVAASTKLPVPPTGASDGLRGAGHGDGHGDGRVRMSLRHTLRSSCRCFKAVVLSSF